MKISLISTSHRQNSESARVRKIFDTIIKANKKKSTTFNLDFYQENLPIWSGDKKNKIGFWGEKWPSISNELKGSDGFIFLFRSMEG